MGVVHNPESEYAKEARKFEAQHTVLGPGERPYVYQEYPKRLYKMGRDAKGRVCVEEAQDAHSAVEQKNLESRGFVSGGQAKAEEGFHANDLEVAKQAANRAAHERTMSPKAREEAAVVDASTDEHVPVIPETPIKPTAKRGRKPKEPKA
ncbi:MAG TPA: hypothetical protein VJ865_11340 [Gemmatimonadaceae bacterium]|nr:hypothetical protein [Gemmatimonadaceae bacterium]